jgi:predicted ATPase
MNGLLERHAELDALRRAISAAGDGQGAVAVVLGEPGLGKTRLLEATQGLAEGAGLRVRVARSAELESSFSFGVVRQLFEPLLAELGDVEREASFAGAAGLARALFEHPEREAR